MPRYMEVALTKRDVRCLAVLLDDEAPKTCEAVWQALPLEGEVFHAKYANNEIYTLFPPFVEKPLDLENYTIMPFTGEIMYFYLRPWHRLPPEFRHIQEAGRGASELAIFYDRDNFIFSPRVGPIPGNIFARVVGDLEGLQAACRSVWREGSIGERLVFRRADAERVMELQAT